MNLSDLCIRADYNRRAEEVFFDDTVLADQYQAEEYRTAVKAFNELGFQSVLDVGCGSAFKLINYFPKEAVKTGVDLDKTVGWLKQKYPDGSWSSSIPEDSFGGSFDMLLCMDVIEHVADPVSFMEKLSKCPLKIGFISTVDRIAVRGVDDIGPPGNGHHLQEWSRDEFHKFVSKYFNVRSQTATPNGGQLLLIEPKIVENVTIIIKTFCRPECMARLHDSIRLLYPEIPIIIADDGEPYAGPFRGSTTHLKLPFDCGLKMGRNLAMALVRTKYFLLCDDDFVFTKNTSIATLVALAERFQMTILGGDIRGGDETKPNDFRVNVAIDNGELIFSTAQRTEHISFCDMVANFYLANTDQFRRHGGWDSRLKIGGHEELFMRFKMQGAKVGITDLSWCVHEQHFFMNGDHQTFEKFRNHRVWDFWPPIAIKEYGVTKCREWECHRDWKGYDRYN